MDEQEFVGGSRRPDGTYRKMRRVKPGYVPPEEQSAFISRGKQFQMDRDAMGVVGLNLAPPMPAASSAAKKKKKRSKPKAKSTPAAAPQPDKAEPQVSAEPLDPVKQEKKLKKKLRQIEQLEADMADGKVTELNEDQKKKLESKADLEAQLAALSL
eukprot:m.40361 g.40361  ORF g.40361 m.40361 type:complete len:156 (+) comp10434_c0_seq1:230-697(+)